MVEDTVDQDLNTSIVQGSCQALQLVHAAIMRVQALEPPGQIACIILEDHQESDGRARENSSMQGYMALKAGISGEIRICSSHAEKYGCAH